MPVKEVHMLATTTGQTNRYGAERYVHACDICSVNSNSYDAVVYVIPTDSSGSRV